MQIPFWELMTEDNTSIHIDAAALYKSPDRRKALCNIEDCKLALSEAAQGSTYSLEPPHPFLNTLG